MVSDRAVGHWDLERSAQRWTMTGRLLRSKVFYACGGLCQAEKAVRGRALSRRTDRELLSAADAASRYDQLGVLTPVAFAGVSRELVHDRLISV